MQVQWINFKTNLNTKSSPYNNYGFIIKNNQKSDTFEKKQTNITFTGKENHNVKTNKNIVDALTAIGFVGGGFALELGLIAAAAKGQNPEDIFLNDGSYFMNTNDMSFNSSHVKADADDGIFKVAGSGVDIDPKRFDYVDVENGIYKNIDKGIDINLLKNKYIDPEKGIFVDPDHKISAIMNHGQLEDIAIPNFGSGYPTCPWDGAWSEMPPPTPPGITRADFIEKYGETPEKYALGHAGNTGYIEILPDDNRNVFEKIKDFFNPGNSELKNENYDIFGREILKTIGQNGKVQFTTIPDAKASEVFKDFLNSGQSIKEAAENTHQVEFREYIKEHPFVFGAEIPFDGSAEGISAPNAVTENLHLKYDHDTIKEVLHKISQDGGYYPNPGSPEAVEFIKYQAEMIDSHLWDSPMIDWHLLCDPDNPIAQTIAEHLTVNGDDNHGIFKTITKFIKSFTDAND